MHRRLLALTCAFACATDPTAPVDVPPIDRAEIDAWRSYATASWWLAGTAIPCDGVVDTSWQVETPNGMRDRIGCTHADGETVSWFPRGDRACPPGATLEGAPGDAIGCARGETDHGRYTDWGAGGSIMKSGEHVDGKPVNLEVVLFPDGTLQSVAHFERGRLHGLTVVFHPNGQRAQQTDFVDGAIDGIATEWHDNGRVARQTHYRAGRIEGPVVGWDEDGRPISRVEAGGELAPAQTER